MDGLENGLGQLTGSNGLVGSLVGGQGLLPSLRESTSQTTLQVLVQLLVLLAVLLEELVPLNLRGGTSGASLVVEVIDVLVNVESLLRVEAELGLDSPSIIVLERVSVDATGTLKLGTIADRGRKLDD